MAFLTDWFEFPDKKKDLTILGELIKDDSLSDTKRPALKLEMRMLLDALAKESFGSSNIATRRAIKSVIIELGHAAISNTDYRKALADSATEYFALALMVCPGDRAVLEMLRKLTPILLVNIVTANIVKQQIEWIDQNQTEREYDLLQKADKLKRSKQNR